jgi:hypothetical protein
MSLLEKARQVAAEFELTDEDVRRTTNHFVDQLSKAIPTATRAMLTDAQRRDSKLMALT